MKKALLLLAVLVSPIFLFGQTAWKQTSAVVTFTIKKSGSDIVGEFKVINATLVFSPDQLATSSLRVVGDVNTLTTGNPKRDATLQGEEHFNAANYPKMEIISTAISKNGEQYTGTFNVIIKGITKQMDIPFEFIQSGNHAEFKCHFTISRRDYGVGKKGLSNLFLSDKVHVSVDVKAGS